MCAWCVCSSLADINYRETIATRSGLSLWVTMVGLRVIISPPPRGNIRALSPGHSSCQHSGLQPPPSASVCVSVVSKYFTNMH